MKKINYINMQQFDVYDNDRIVDRMLEMIDKINELIDHIQALEDNKGVAR